MKTIACTTLMMVIAILAAGVSGAPIYEERRLTLTHAGPLTDARPQSCPTIIDASKFWGTCCSLSSTMSGGCVLSVANGWCKISGPYWADTWTSTDNSLVCPSSEFEIDYQPDSSAGTGTGTDTGTGSPPSGTGVANCVDEAFAFSNCATENAVSCGQDCAYMDVTKLNDDPCILFCCEACKTEVEKYVACMGVKCSATTDASPSGSNEMLLVGALTWIPLSATVALFW